MSPFKEKLDGPVLYQEFAFRVPEMLEKYNHFLSEREDRGLRVDGEGVLLNPMAERLSGLAGSTERLSYAAAVGYDATINFGDLVPGGRGECEELRSIGWFKRFFDKTDLVIRDNLAVVGNSGVEVRLAIADGEALGEREREAIGAMLVMEAEMLYRAEAGGLIVAREKAMGKGWFLGSSGAEILSVYIPRGTGWSRVLSPVGPAAYLREKPWEKGPKPVVFLRAMADGEGPR